MAKPLPDPCKIDFRHKTLKWLGIRNWAAFDAAVVTSPNAEIKQLNRAIHDIYDALKQGENLSVQPTLLSQLRDAVAAIDQMEGLSFEPKKFDDRIMVSYLQRIYDDCVRQNSQAPGLSP